MMSDLSTAISSLKAIKDTTKFIADVSKEFDKVELRLKVVELVSQVSDLSDELQELRQKLMARDSATYHNGVYWQNGKQDSGDPYCPRCLEASDRLVHMHECEHDSNMFSAGCFVWRCIDCKAEVLRPDKKGKPQKPMPAPMAF